MIVWEVSTAWGLTAMLYKCWLQRLSLASRDGNRVEVLLLDWVDLSNINLTVVPHVLIMLWFESIALDTAIPASFLWNPLSCGILTIYDRCNCYWEWRRLVKTWVGTLHGCWLLCCRCLPSCDLMTHYIIVRWLLLAKESFVRKSRLSSFIGLISWLRSARVNFQQQSHLKYLQCPSKLFNRADLAIGRPPSLFAEPPVDAWP